MKTLRANGLDLCVDDRGSGEPVLLIMGIAAQLTVWPDGFVQELVERGFRVIRFDNRDVGQSTVLHELGVPDPRPLAWRRLIGQPVPAPYTLADMADDAVGVLDALGLADAHIVGSSMGGMIAQVVALRHPARVRTLTSIMSSPGDLWSSIGSPRALGALASPPPQTVEQAVALRWKVTQVFNGPVLPLDEAAEKAAAARDWERGHHPEGAARQLAAILASPDRRRALGSLDLPAHVIHGTHDPLMPVRGGRATARAIPGATLQLVRGMGHHMPAATWSPVADGIEEVARRARPTATAARAGAGGAMPDAAP